MHCFWKLRSALELVATFALLISFQVVTAQNDTLSCLKNTLAVELVMDTSGSIRNQRGAFERELEWALTLSENILQSEGNQVGLLAFNTRVYPEFPLTPSIDEFRSNIDFFKNCRRCQPTGRTATHLGLQKAREELQRSAPSGSKKVIVLLTDGAPYIKTTSFKSNCGYEPDCETYHCDYTPTSRGVTVYTEDPTCAITRANEAKDDGITILSVGVGQVVEDPSFEDLLKLQIASDESGYLRATEFDRLDELASRLQETLICDSTRYPKTEDGSCSCECKEGFLDPEDDSLPCIKITTTTTTSTAQPATSNDGASGTNVDGDANNGGDNVSGGDSNDGTDDSNSSHSSGIGDDSTNGGDNASGGDSTNGTDDSNSSNSSGNGDDSTNGGDNASGGDSNNGTDDSNSSNSSGNGDDATNGGDNASGGDSNNGTDDSNSSNSSGNDTDAANGGDNASGGDSNNDTDDSNSSNSSGNDDGNASGSGSSNDSASGSDSSGGSGTNDVSGDSNNAVDTSPNGSTNDSNANADGDAINASGGDSSANGTISSSTTTSQPALYCDACLFAFEKSSCILTTSLSEPNTGEKCLNGEQITGTWRYNVDNRIVIPSESNNRIKYGCNSYGASYRGDDGEWHETFIDTAGNIQPLSNVFYVTGHDRLMQRTIQRDWSNLQDVLEGRLVRMKLLCDNVKRGCLLFRVKKD